MFDTLTKEEAEELAHLYKNCPVKKDSCPFKNVIVENCDDCNFNYEKSDVDNE